MTDKAIEKPAKSPATVLDVFQSSAFTEQVATALPAHIKPETMMRVALTEVRTNELLQKCSPASFMGALLKAAQCGLRPGMFGECYLIPRWNGRLKCYEASFQAGYQGLVQLAHNSGYVDEISAFPVYAQDQFSYRLGTDPGIDHIPDLSGSRRDDDITFFYAVIKLKTGGRQLAVLTRSEVDDIRDKYGAAKSKETGKVTGPWVTAYAEMGKKTVLLRALKLVPKDSDRLALAISAEHREPLHREISSHATQKTIAERVAEKIGIDQATGEVLDAEAVETAE